MKYLVDSDWVADYLKGRRQAVALLTNLRPAGLAISVITYGEIYQGIHYGDRPNEDRLVFENFLRAVLMLNVDRAIAHQFAVIRGALYDQGMPIPQPDILIAATAIHHDLTLVTRNLRHFERIPGLKIYPESTQ